MRWPALSRWDNEGGASPIEAVDGSEGDSFRHDAEPAPGMAETISPVLPKVAASLP